MFQYETHLHTYPVSLCAKAGVVDTLNFYKELGYSGVFITNHFLDGNINVDHKKSYSEKLDFYFSDFHFACEVGNKIDLKVFLGVEISYKGTDFLIYGLPEAWYYQHPEIMQMRKTEELMLFMESGALVVQAHPFREASYIDHIRLFPRCVHGVEVINACRTELENQMAKIYAHSYGLLEFAGSDNHRAGKQPKLAGMQADTPILDELDFVQRVKANTLALFSMDNPVITKQNIDEA